MYTYVLYGKVNSSVMIPFHDHLVQAVRRLSMGDLLASEKCHNKTIWHYNESLFILKLDWKAELIWFYKKITTLSHLEGEGTSLLTNFFQKGFLHWCFRHTSIRGGINLNVFDPNVSPEGQSDDVQVVTSITEGTSEVDKYCSGKCIITAQRLNSELITDNMCTKQKYLFCHSDQKDPLSLSHLLKDKSVRFI